MDELILHHYPMSPFAEKARLMLGAKGLAWRSVIIPAVMPKPDVLALTGGYRKTPLLQIGADIYCDTALIARVLESRQPMPSLYPASAPLAAALAQWADRLLFWPVATVAMQPAGAAALLRNPSPETVKAFRSDRAAFTQGMARPSLSDALAALNAALPALEAQLQQAASTGPWLLGSDVSIADFAVAHQLWFIRQAGPVAEVLAPYPALNAWLDRMLALGHGRSQPMDGAEAVAVAAAASAAGRHATVAVAAGQGLEAGEPVSVAATDYGQDPSPGLLVGLDDHEVVIRRDDPRAGTVQVHFPRSGFQIRKENKA